jgi:hypothetical protein
MMPTPCLPKRQRPPAGRSLLKPETPGPTINTGFYMLMPYLAGHLAHDFGMAAWTIGLSWACVT